MTSFRKIGLLAIGLAIGLASSAAAEEQSPWFGRWAKAKLQHAMRLGDRREAIRAAIKLYVAVRPSAESPLPIDAEPQNAPLEEFVASGPFFGHKDAKLYFDRGRVRMKNGQHRQAIDDFDECLRLEPSSVAALLTRGIARAILGEYDQALLDFDRGIALQPKFGDAYRVRGYCRLSKGDSAGAIEDFEQFVQYDPQAAAFGARALAHTIQGEYEQAIEDLNRAYELDPNDRRVLLLRAAARFNKGDYPWAVEDFDRLLALNSKPAADNYFGRALAWSKLDQYAKARVDVDQAARLDAKFSGQMHFVHASEVRFVFQLKNMQWNVSVSAKPPKPKRSLQRAAPAAQPTPPADATPATAQHGDFNAASSLKDRLDGWNLAVKTTQDPSPSPPENGRPITAPSQPPRVVARWLPRADEDHARELSDQAWMLATSRYERNRDGVRAIETAREACEITQWRDSACLESLAAACAECGDFESADKHQTRAMELGPADAAGRRAGFVRLGLYRARQPVSAGE